MFKFRLLSNYDINRTYCRLKQPCGDPLPFELGRTGGTVDQPHIPIPGTRRHLSIREEVKTRKPQLGEPRIGVGRRENIDGEWTIVMTDGK